VPNISAPELVVILIIALLVLGPQRLPQVARSVGKGLREFRAALSSEQQDEEEEEEEEEEDPEALHASRQADA
jgi:sec-independent protein translocase protein TatA